MPYIRRFVGLALGVFAGVVAVVFAYSVRHEFVRYSALDEVGRGRFWFAIGIIGIAAILSILTFVFRLPTQPASWLTRYTIGSLIASLVCAGIIYYGMPP